VKQPRSANRVVCYCKSCQAFAHFLGRQSQILDERGGTDVIQMLPKNVSFTQGIEALACMRLTEKGLLRWYASCCNTPIGNTLANFKFSFIGLVHECLEGSDTPLQDSFGPVRSWINTDGAKGDPKPKASGIGAFIPWFVSTVLKARINGDYKQNAFFLKDTGAPIVRPRVLERAELAALMAR
jgi:Family of unknown function (DUF6151)